MGGESGVCERRRGSSKHAREKGNIAGLARFGLTGGEYIDDYVQATFGRGGNEVIGKRVKRLQKFGILREVRDGLVELCSELIA
jgi:hypothetical protein